MLYDVVSHGIHSQLKSMLNDVLGNPFLHSQIHEVVSETEDHRAIPVHGNHEAVLK